MSRHFQFDAYAAYEAMKDRYADFLLDHFNIRPGALRDILIHNWTSPGSDPFRLFAPLIVQGAFPFKPGLKPAELRAEDSMQPSIERPLHPKTLALLESAGMSYALYEHQVDAIRSAAEGKTIILSAGTGSGKTESFLIPIIDRLFWDHELGRDDLRKPGIRAIIVYPLNALVNNQVDRLRSLLGSQQDITFAYFTSRLKNEERVAVRMLERRQKTPIPCEIIDRQTLRGLSKNHFNKVGPPHILVTNYSMLEYMLIRPLDRSIFMREHLFGQSGPRLKSIVLDEAHVYAGALAAEIHMLLRRTARRFGTTLDEIQGYATSATLSQGKDGSDHTSDPLKVFATRMFSKGDAQVAAIRGERYLPTSTFAARPLTTLCSPSSLPPSGLIPSHLYTLEYDRNGSPARLVLNKEMGALAAKSCVRLGIANEAEVAQLSIDELQCPARLLYRLVSSHPMLLSLRSWLFAREKDRLPSLAEVAEYLYGKGENTEQACRAADAVLRLASLARTDANQLPFIPIRMHAFVRAPLGIWVDPRPDEAHLPLPAEWHWGEISSMPPEATDPIPRMELLLCPTCGEPYLEAWEESSGRIVARDTSDLQRVLLWPDESSERRLEGLGERQVRVIRAEREKWDAKTEYPCVRCGEGLEAMRRLRLSPRAALGAIVDSIYPHLGEIPPGPDTPAFMPGGGRRLLSFSDSRQQAAEVATRVENTHDVGLNRQLLWNALVLADEDASIATLVDELAQQPGLKERAAACGAQLDSDVLEDLARLSLYEEFARLPPSGNSLEILGMVEVLYPSLPGKPQSLTWLDATEWQAFLSGILDDSRRRGVVIHPAFVSAMKQDLEEPLRYSIGKSLIWSTGADQGVSINGDDDDPGETVPLLTKKSLRRPYYYAERLIRAAGDPAGVTPESLLQEAWNSLVDAARTLKCKWLKLGRSQMGGTETLRIDLGRLKLKRHDAPGWIEPASRRVYFRAVKAVCPDRPGPRTLQPMTDDDIKEWKARHAIQRVIQDQPLGLWSVEHTAQIDVDALEGEEQAFRRGERNLLASSTTMEMGVDLGGLTFVLLTNVPPGPSNYWQRAGRAGRRVDGSSMVLTLALGRPHDQKVFADPRALLHEPVTPPRVRLDTRSLLQRHVSAYLLGAFFEEVIEYSKVGNPIKSFGTVDEFVFKSLMETGGLKADAAKRLGLEPKDPLAHGFLRWLAQIGSDRVVRDGLQHLVHETELDGSTPEELARDCGVHLENALWTARQDLEVILKQQGDESKKGDGKQDTGFLKALGYQLIALRQEALISYLARSGFLPRFGFPVDVVRLDTRWKVDAKDDFGPREDPLPELRMERDLAMALSEYAPGAQVIAAKRVYEVSGVVRNWLSDDQTAVEKFFYLQCTHCGHFEVRRSDMGAGLNVSCQMCGHQAQDETQFVENSREVSSKQRKARRARKEGKEVDTPPEGEGRMPSPVRHYLQPSGFAVKWGTRPKQLGPDLHRMPPTRVSVMASGADRIREELPGLLAVGFAPGSSIFVRSEGRSDTPDAHGFGFLICRLCGFTQPEDSWDKKLPPKFAMHRKLRGSDKCLMTHQYWRHAVLGTTVRVDAFRVRLLGDLAPRLADKELEDFYLTLATLLQQKAAEFLQIDSRGLHATVGTWRAPVGTVGLPPGVHREAILYEDSGSGMLERIADRALELVQETVQMLQDSDTAAFVRFDTQFLIRQGRLRLDLLRDHFLEPGLNLKEYLNKTSYLQQEDAHILRGRGPRLAALELLSTRSSRVALQAPALAEDAFGRRGLLRALMQRSLGDHGESRLLLAEVPDPNRGGDEAYLLATKLQRLLEDGVEVRQVRSSDKRTLEQSPWRLLARRPGDVQALGAMVPDVGGLRGIGCNGVAFGDGWIEGAVPVEAGMTAAETAWEEHELLWASATPVTRDQLTPRPSRLTHYILIPEGSPTASSSGAFTGIFSNVKELGPVETWGQVSELVYNDRYIARNAVGMWMLEKLLSTFRYATGATATIRHETQRDESCRDFSVQDIFNAPVPPGSLTASESHRLQHWCSTAAKKRGLLVTFKEQPYFKQPRMSHARTLQLKFTPDSPVAAVKVLFERGLDWVYPVTGVGAWTQRDLRANEAHIVITVELRK